MPYKLKSFEFGKEVIAVFVSKLNWIQYEYADHTKSTPLIFNIETGPQFDGPDENLVRLAIRRAIVMRDKWIAVEYPV